MAYSINFLSPSSSQPILVVGTGRADATLIHFAPPTSQLDEVFLYVNNTGAASYPLVMQIVGTSVQQETITMIPPQNIPQLVLPGWLITNESSIFAYSPSGSGLFLIGGYIQRGP